MTLPPAEALAAFIPPSHTVDNSSLHALEGGRGSCYIFQPSTNSSTWIVLRPADDPIEAEFLAELSSKLLKTPSLQYRLARPVPVSNTKPARYMSPDNWTAQSYLAGEAKPKGRWEQLFAASHAFHADFANVCPQKPSFILDDPSKTNRWREADLVIWGEKSLGDVPNVSDEMMLHFQSVFDRLEGFKARLGPEPEWTAQCQLIHGDLTGNVLFETTGGGSVDIKLPPAIIDLTPYWRPVLYADAIVLADALAWYGEGLSLIHTCDFVTDERLHLLIKALYWRALTFAIDTDVDWIKAHLGKADYEGAVEVVAKAIAELHEK